MSILDWLNDEHAVLPVAAAIMVAAVAALLESAVGLIVWVPAAPVVIVAAAGLASVPRILLLIVVVAIGRLAGDSIAFGYGRRQGAQLASSPIARRIGPERWQTATRVLDRRGPMAALLVRLVPVPRTLTPAIAGAGGMPAGRFVPASAVASLCWAALWVVVGVLARASFHVTEPYLGVGGWLVVAVLAVIGAVYLAVRALVLRLPDGDPRRVLGDSSVAGMAPHPSGDDTGLRVRLFHEDEWRTLPNVISAIRILLLPVFGVLLVVHHFWSAIVVLLLVFVSDFVDGFIARRFHQTSNLGAWLDPVADRLTVVFVVAAFAASGIVPWQLVLILLIPDILSGLWAVFSFNGAPDVKVSKVGKVRTALLFVGLFMMLFGEAVPMFERGLVGVGFAFFVLGVVGHYMAMARNARGLITLWQRQALGVPLSAPAAPVAPAPRDS
ncbi:CDP-alcohol phosphatidyltransferase family protein [Frondihabitans australicus]|uniref:CDP-diacylglycerol--glycerol-3-phosphate 3-phosphatidyltransferase n=1 Tax=Frondihabitans australicus TaxID=386892 RepID=A0A495IM84_9MICO|nr:CDP-alcohol phosphatidyltransferase family protein [Frondihabitans australicus]RKR76235.1 CDP-diacylglycerol--glycerol-3-phosphate 3-phosphatidyltransferase [Frondihabitans australicus]